jgi:hypothetical protein
MGLNDNEWLVVRPGGVDCVVARPRYLTEEDMEGMG